MDWNISKLFKSSWWNLRTKHQKTINRHFQGYQGTNQFILKIDKGEKK